MSETFRQNKHSNRRKRHPQDNPEVEAKMVELESSGEPLSLAETLSIKEAKASSKSDVDAEERIIINVTELQKMTIKQLMAYAAKEKVEVKPGMQQRELMMEIIKSRVTERGIMFGEGTLQILPDGFGFLRSPEYHYLSCPDDIYVSPSQIRKFNLRNGAIVSGQIRPPKENERYFALLRVEAINGLDPNENSSLVQFDNLTPLHPNQRIIMEHDPKELSTRIMDMVTPIGFCLLYTSPSPRDATLSRMPSSA